MAGDKFEKDFDDRVYDDDYYDENYDQEELIDDDDMDDDDDDVTMDIDEDDEDLFDEDGNPKKFKESVSYACEDCDYRWDDVIVKRKDDLNYDDDPTVVCPMCGSMNCNQI